MTVSANASVMRSSNDIRVISLLRGGPLTRRELQQHTSLSWGGITNTVNRLADAGFIKEHKSETRQISGRTPCRVSLREDDNLVIGLDVNSTGLTGCVMSLTGKTLSKKSAVSDYSSAGGLLNAIDRLLASLISDYPDARYIAAGISMQGEVDSANGISVRLSQVDGWENIPLCKIISEKFGFPVYIAHDPDCMLHSCITDSGVTNGILLRIDTAIGMAAVVSGRMLTGCGLLEAGHMITDPNGPVCTCGAKGCLSAYLKKGTVSEIAEQLSNAVHNLIQLFRPDTLILTGELVEKHPEFISEFNAAFKKLPYHVNTDIITLSDTHSAMKGAALIAADNALNSIDIY